METGMTIGSRLAAVPRDYYGGGLMMLIGGLAAAIGSSYSVGSLSRMGPGYFPVGLGILLMLVGVGMAVTCWFEHAPRRAVGTDTPPAEWRGWTCIVGSTIAFIVLGRHGGFVPATAAVVFISALGDRNNTMKDAALLALAMIAVLVIVFWWALKMTFPLFVWGAA
jgi:hypothetical protein